MSLKIGICVNHYSPSVGGAEMVAQTITEYLAKYHQVFVFTRKLHQKRDFKSFSYPVFEYTTGDLPYFEKRIQQLNLDVLFVYSDVFDFFRQIISCNHSYKLVIALCGANWIYSHSNFVNTLYRHSKNVNALICHSKCERDYRLCQSERLKEKTEIIPNGVWTSEFDSNIIIRQELIPDIASKIWVLNVSNFFPGKGQEHIIKILSGMSNPEQLAYIQVASDIDFAVGKQLESKWRINAKSLENKGICVRLIKNASRDKVVGFFKQSNVFLFSSEKEVAPIVLLESMAASLPWVSTNVGNAQDLQGGKCITTMKDSRFYSVFDRRTNIQFMDHIQYLFNNPSVGELGRKQINEELNWDKILPSYRRVIEECQN